MAQPTLPGPTPADELVVLRDGGADLLSSSWWHGKLVEFVNWMTSSGLRVVLIVILYLIALKLVRAFVRRTILLTVRPQGDDALQDLMVTKRQATLLSLFDATATITLSLVALLMILQAIGLSVGPLLASAGIAGVAIGFGAQSLVKDILSGAFMIMEQQFSVGDVIRTCGISGNVEQIKLRTVVLRDVDGGVHIIPNGQIEQVTVLTRDWSRLVLDLDIAYDADMETAASIVKRVLESYAAAHTEDVLEPPEVLGVQNLAESSVQLRAWVKLLPGKQWAAGRALRAEIKRAFDDAGIEIPFPQRTLWIRQEKSS